MENKTFREVIYQSLAFNQIILLKSSTIRCDEIHQKSHLIKSECSGGKKNKRSMQRTIGNTSKLNHFITNALSINNE